jgi:cell wall-associated NlpC family hydrolase
LSWREDVIAEGMTYLGTPYIAKARIKGVGVDCGGLLYNVYGKFFGPLPPFPQDYAPDWCRQDTAERYIKFILPFVEQVRVPLAGDIAVFHIGNAFAHGAIVLGGERFLHAFGRNGQGEVIVSKGRMLTRMSVVPPKFFTPVV